MTPKEKAKELFDKYATYVVMWSGGIKVENQNCKQCALIAVNEILNEYPSQCPKDSYEMERHIFWQDVKKELLNMK